MGKDRVRSSDARAKKRGRRAAERALRQREARAEEHVRVRLRREASEEYAIRRRGPEGDYIKLTEDQVELLRAQRNRFIQKFGREPGEDVPVFFDEDANRSQRLFAENDKAMFRRGVEAAGINPAHADVYEELGYLVTEENRNNFSFNEVEAYQERLAFHTERRERGQVE